jgi:hypothetical protein
VRGDTPSLLVFIDPLCLFKREDGAIMFISWHITLVFTMPYLLTSPAD